MNRYENDAWRRRQQSLIDLWHPISHPKHTLPATDWWRLIQNKSNQITNSSLLAKFLPLRDAMHLTIKTLANS